jgi:hypothetical protein
LCKSNSAIFNAFRAKTRINDEIQNPNDETNSNFQFLKLPFNAQPFELKFGIWKFIRHSNFVIRHFLLHVFHTLFAGDRFLRALARAGIGAGALPTHRQAAAMPYAAVTANVFQSGDVLRYLPAKLTFDRVVFIQQRGHARHFVFMELASLRLRVDSCLVTQLPRNSRTNAIQILKRNERRFVGRNVNAE